MGHLTAGLKTWEHGTEELEPADPPAGALGRVSSQDEEAPLAPAAAHPVRQSALACSSELLCRNPALLLTAVGERDLTAIAARRVRTHPRTCMDLVSLSAE